MSESLLKKEFREKDLQRMRNIITKKYGDSVNTQIGFVKKEEERKEGDIWVENDKSWTIKNGIKQTYTKLDSVKSVIRTPMLCPICSNRMKHSIDKKMYSVHGKCHSCVIEIESTHKRNGTYQQYVNDFVNKNILTELDEAEQFIMDFAQSKASNFVTEHGDIEEMVGDIDKEKMIANWRKELDETREKLKIVKNND